MSAYGQQPLKRWSEDRKHSMNVPTYVPPELFTVAKGQAMAAFMKRSAFQDMLTMEGLKLEDEWYQRKRRKEDKPVYNAAGERVNTSQMVFKEKKMRLVQDILALSSRVNQKTAQSDSRITKKIYFTKDQIHSKAFGAIIGARGKTHKELQQSTGCKISLLGKGISDMHASQPSTNSDHKAGEDDAPHCHITAPSEEALKRCVEKIEFIISDKQEAIDFRNQNRKEVAILNGTYREDMWNTSNKPGFNSMAAAPPQRNMGGADDELKRFMSEIGGPGSVPPPPPPGSVPGRY
eukprot:TRINITY_DN10509_c0_g1_i1.p1 TRINITY_DN10509_c0_g1~~TRINITY_DN10509_c0_g1_i1.p1  ORF type:complete len:292 (+),score=74.17 TRINITY_DN10509_c0_g1_i1:50-925(+)